MSVDEVPGATPDVQKETSLYRFFGAGDELLYVGITARGRGRWHQHNADKAWWPDVARATVEHYPTRDDALTAERDAIIAERPRHNVVHNGGAKCERRRSDPSTPPFRGAVEVEFGSLRYRTRWRGHLWLSAEVCLDPCTWNVDEDESLSIFGYWVDQLRSSMDVPDELPIFWSIDSDCGIFQYAPYRTDLILRDEDDFLATYTWPTVVATGEPLDWFRLPVEWDVPATLKAEIGWYPAPLQSHMPLRQIINSRRGIA